LKTAGAGRISRSPVESVRWETDAHNLEVAGSLAQLYPGISPVNTFRVVFNAYLGADLPLLKDVSYFSPIPQIYHFTEVPNLCTGR